MVKGWGTWLGDPATGVGADLAQLHGFLMLVCAGVLGLVGVGLASVVANSLSGRSYVSNTTLELLWTGLPGVVLASVALPSLRVLYALEEVEAPAVTCKAVGHQWYWSYEVGDAGVEFDSYMVGGGVRLLEVDKRLVVPFGVPVRMLVTSADVIHSWAVPELGVKVDAVPGRLNQVGLVVSRPGVYRGMCSELCGVNHAYMPIVVEAVGGAEFSSWLEGFDAGGG